MFQDKLTPQQVLRYYTHLYAHLPHSLSLLMQCYCVQLAAMQRSMQNVPPSVVQEQLKAFEAMTPDQRRSLAERASTIDPNMLASQAEEYAKSANWKSLREAESLKAEGNALHTSGSFAAAAAKYKLALETLQQASESAAKTG